jgi:hypothetical protein
MCLEGPADGRCWRLASRKPGVSLTVPPQTKAEVAASAPVGDRAPGFREVGSRELLLGATCAAIRSVDDRTYRLVAQLTITTQSSTLYCVLDCVVSVQSSFSWPCRESGGSARSGVLLSGVMTRRVGAVVVRSGFGAVVAACRLAQKGGRWVYVLDRGVGGLRAISALARPTRV